MKTHTQLRVSFYFYIYLLHIAMKHLSDVLCEAQTEKSTKFNKIESILVEDPLSSRIIKRQETYEANRLASAREPKFLFREANDTYSWLTVDKIDEDDFGKDTGFKGCEGIHIDGQFYAFAKPDTALNIYRKLTEKQVEK